jgi:hypothetical protein
MSVSANTPRRSIAEALTSNANEANCESIFMEEFARRDTIVSRNTFKKGLFQGPGCTPGQLNGLNLMWPVSDAFF